MCMIRKQSQIWKFELEKYSLFQMIVRRGTMETSDRAECRAWHLNSEC